MEQATLERLISRYFSQSERRLSVTAGETVLKQNAHNDRLYYVLSGELEGFVVDDESMKDTKVFTAVSGAFIGVHSFFLKPWLRHRRLLLKPMWNWRGLIWRLLL